MGVLGQVLKDLGKVIVNIHTAAAFDMDVIDEEETNDPLRAKLRPTSQEEPDQTWRSDTWNCHAANSMNSINLYAGAGQARIISGLIPTITEVQAMAYWIVESINQKGPVQLPRSLIVELMLRRFSEVDVENFLRSCYPTGFSGIAWSCEKTLHCIVFSPIRTPMQTFVLSRFPNATIWNNIQQIPGIKQGCTEPAAPWIAEVMHDQGMKLYEPSIWWLMDFQKVLAATYMNMVRSKAGHH